MVRIFLENVPGTFFIKEGKIDLLSCHFLRKWDPAENCGVPALLIYFILCIHLLSLPRESQILTCTFILFFYFCGLRVFLNIISVDPFYQTGHRSCLMTSRTFQECLKMIQYHDTFYLKKLNLGPRQNLFALAR